MVFGYDSYSYRLFSRVRGGFLEMFERLLPAQRPGWNDLSNKTALVTGANIGIGLEIARGLAARGATVVLACRNLEKAESARKDILEKSKGSIREEQVECMLLNLADLDSVRALAKSWGTRPLDILVNNAGITTGTFTKNPQGYELTYATNILSHYLLSLLLLPMIRPNGRIVNISSAGHMNAKPFDVLDLDFSKGLKTRGMEEGKLIVPGGLTFFLYGRSKCLQIIFTKELQRRLEQNEAYKHKNITIHSCHPGLVRSAIWDRPGNITISNMFKSMLLFTVNILGISTTEGAATAIYLAINDFPAKNPGLYWSRMLVTVPNPVVKDVQAGKLIFDQMAIEAGLAEEQRL
ncbi:hypothetical protein DL96DRAFT_1705464 [Flagelloscypha sp. PMI_526]|nr:hypothetical protein DL96DRAFT_1705464 [Flagelloscypha sp. PMI_526]